MQKWFAEAGFKAKISEATHELRRLGYPVIAGTGRKGYRYADETIPDLAEAWTSRFELYERGVDNAEKQRQIDMAILDEIIAKLTKPEDAERKEALLVIRERYRRARAE